MAQKKAGGCSKNGRDSKSKRLGFKLYGGSIVFPGNIILRQKGSKFLSGKNTNIGKDFTIFSLEKGFIYFTKKNKKKYINVDKIS